MRIKVLLRVSGRLPISYSYYFGSYIIRALGKRNEEIAARIHSMMPYKPYNFSRLLAKPKKVQDGFLDFGRSAPATVYIASIDKDLILAILDALLTYGQIRIWKRLFTIEGVEAVDYPKPPLRYATLSPVYLSISKNGKKVALSPGDPLFHEELVANILRKYATFTGKPYTGRISITYEDIRPRMRHIKGTRIPCYDMSGEIYAEEDMLRKIWDLGLGEKNALGFGMVGHADVYYNRKG